MTRPFTAASKVSLIITKLQMLQNLFITYVKKFKTSYYNNFLHYLDKLIIKKSILNFKTIFFN